MRFLLLILVLFGCNSGGGSKSSSAAKSYDITLSFTRLPQAGPDPFTVRAALTQDGTLLKGKSLTLSVPKGTVSSIVDNNNGTYDFTVTPASTGIYPVTVSFNGKSVTREAVVLNNILTGAGQPLMVPGLVNTEGYEDGITITPDGEYLFIQYGPFYFSGIFLHAAICADGAWSMYDLGSCSGKDDSDWVFNTIGPYNTSSRPNFPDDAINGASLSHIPSLVIPGTVNGLVLFPTVFYGFKRQSDGTFKEPFKVAFNDARGTNGPFGLSFQMTGATSAKFVVSWNNYFNQLGDDKPDIYEGTLTMGQEKNLGDVTYSGEFFSGISPLITPVNFTSHAGVQGNPHLYYDGSGNIQSIWTDDEQVSHDITVYQLSSGQFPSGTWTPANLPAQINTASAESQPFFNGSKLYLNRDTKIVYHDYLGGDYALNSSWGNEVVVLQSGDVGVGTIFGVGEPTLAVRDGKSYLYFAVVESRAAGSVGRYDYNLGAAYLELP